MSVFSLLILISWEQVTQSPSPHTKISHCPFSRWTSPCFLILLTPVCPLNLPYKFCLFRISPVSVFYCPLCGLLEFLHHPLLPSALPCMLFSYGLAFPENTLLLLLPPPPWKSQISRAGSQRGAAHHALAVGAALLPQDLIHLLQAEQREKKSAERELVGSCKTGGHMAKPTHGLGGDQQGFSRSRQLSHMYALWDSNVEWDLTTDQLCRTV